MGLDFRSLVVNSLVKVSLERFSSAVRAATNKFLNETKVLSVSTGEISSLSERGAPTSGPPQPSPEISMWDDICVYGNAILEALNNLRYTPSPMLESFTELDMRAIIASCDGGERIEEILQNLSSRERFLAQEELFLSQQDQMVTHENASTAADQLDTQEVKAPEFTDTSMCSPPQHDSSIIHFDLGDDQDEAKVENLDPVPVTDSNDLKTAASHSQQDPDTAETQLTVATDDDLPALVETAPSPLYSETELVPTQETDQQSDKQNSERSEHAKKD
ncbi:hypothetical protein TELCIR_12863 [Teladorsagia circumcincta]|uniref:Uncharacterized protein n=1 Tax=Teladorsagia circumcincta TaxID=45464 RepID=A0A2G9U5K7_TELCI|nr:hypothetical protein TELCIR_12863 [Teladorsagia circumcincta]